jgi:hypothetical protein
MALDFDNFAEEIWKSELPPLPHKKPIAALPDIVSLRDLEVYDFQRNIPKRFENGTDKECIGYQIFKAIKMLQKKGNLLSSTIQQSHDINTLGEQSESEQKRTERLMQTGSPNFRKKASQNDRKILETIMAEARSKLTTRFQMTSFINNIDEDDEQHEFFLRPKSVEIPKVVRLAKTKKLRPSPSRNPESIGEPTTLPDISGFNNGVTSPLKAPIALDAVPEDDVLEQSKKKPKEEELEKPVIDFLRKFNRLKAKEMAQKARDLINNLAKAMKSKKNKVLPVKETDLKKFEQIQKCLKEFSKDGNMKDLKERLRALIDGSIGLDTIMGEEFALLFKAVPSLGKRLPKLPVEKNAAEGADGFTVYGANNEPIFVKLPERYRRLSSTVVMPHQTLVPVGKRKNSSGTNERKDETDLLLGFEFFKDLETLLDRQFQMESAAMSIIGNRTDDLHLHEIRIYNFDEGIQFLWNEFTHLKLVQEPIVPQYFAKEIYDLLHDNDYNEKHVVSHLKKLIGQLFHKYSVYIKAFSGHLKRVLIACNEFPTSVVAYIFGNLLFRTELPKTNDLYIAPVPMQVPLKSNTPMISMWDSLEDMAVDRTFKENGRNSVQRDHSGGRNSIVQEERLSLVVDGRRASLFREEKRGSVVSKPIAESIPETEHNPEKPIAKLQRDKSRLKSFTECKPTFSKKFTSTPKKHSYLYELPFLPPGKEPSQYNIEERQKFGWDSMTKDDITTMFDEQIVHTPFSKALELILIHWNAIFPTR